MKGNEKVQREAKLRGFIDQQGRKANYIHPRNVEGLPQGTEMEKCHEPKPDLCMRILQDKGPSCGAACIALLCSAVSKH